MSTSQLILRTTPLTFSSHPLHLSFLVMYHPLLSTSLIINLIMADLEIKPFVRPPPPTHSFRLTGSIDRPAAFIENILDSQLILNSPSSLEDLAPILLQLDTF